MRKTGKEDRGMGTILRAACAKCGYQTELFTGGGLRDCYPETALAAAPNDLSLAEALRRGARFQIDRAAAVCSRCRKLFAMPYVTYWPEGGESRHTAAACPDCNNLLTRLSAAAESVSCPVCGQTILLTRSGHWD